MPRRRQRDLILDAKVQPSSINPFTMSGKEFVWYPSDQVKRDANWTAFIRATGMPDYPALVSRSSSDPDWFWKQLIRFLDFRFYKPYEKVRDLSRGLPHAEWCVGGTTNFVLNALDKRTPEERARLAIVWEGEDGEVRRWTYDELDAETCRVAAGLSALGIRKGDVVGVCMPLVPELVAAFLGIAKVGGITLPLFSGFGPEALSTRLQDGGAVALFTIDGTLRRGRPGAMKAVVDEALANVPTLKHVIVARRLKTQTPMTQGRDIWWEEFTAGHSPKAQTMEVEAEHPLMLIYTSGTTGRPKGIVHTHCGLPIKATQDAQLDWEFKPGSRVMWMADFGWMGGPKVIIGCLMTGSTAVLVEGAPDYPESSRFWRLIQDHGVTIVGIPPTLARSMRRYGDNVPKSFDLSSLQIIVSGGEPSDAESWMWVFNNIGGGRVPIMNSSGGTEVCSIIATNILYPLKPGCFHGSVLGCGADVVDAVGNSVAPGEIGELAMREASIGRTRGLWKDPERYLKSYWEQIPGIWVHGDLASRDMDGCWYLHGRSDDTIKVAGKRVGPAEIEELLLATRLVSEAAAVGIPDSVKGSAVVCVTIPAPGQAPGDQLAQELSAAIVRGMGSSFRPQRVLFVSDLPRNRTMKVMRRVIRNVLAGESLGDLSSLANPGAIEELRELAAPSGERLPDLPIYPRAEVPDG